MDSNNSSNNNNSSGNDIPGENGHQNGTLSNEIEIEAESNIDDDDDVVTSQSQSNKELPPSFEDSTTRNPAAATSAAPEEDERESTPNTRQQEVGDDNEPVDEDDEASPTTSMPQATTTVSASETTIPATSSTITNSTSTNTTDNDVNNSSPNVSSTTRRRQASSSPIIQNHRRSNDDDDDTRSDNSTTAITNKESSILLPRDPSLQWHEGSVTSSRVLIPPADQSPQQQASVPILPCSPPSMRNMTNEQEEDQDEVVAVFNANSVEGKSMVRALAKSSSTTKVIAVVRVFTSRNTKSLLQLGSKNVVVKVADSHDRAALAKAVTGAHRAFFVTSYWERFDSPLEERQALLVLDACASQGVRHLVLSSFEDTRILREKKLKSQIVPNQDGTIEPKFEGMQTLKEAAKNKGVLLTHMITSYVDQEHSKKSLCLIVGENGNLIINSHTPVEV